MTRFIEITNLTFLKPLYGFGVKTLPFRGVGGAYE
jgi:hypothetical protein